MKRHTTYAVAAWALAVGLALSLAACGSEPAATTTQVTLQSSPPAEVWIGDESQGTTPVQIMLVAGTHEVTFKAPGFVDVAHAFAVEPGSKPLTVEAELCADTEADGALTLVAQALGIEREPYQEPEVHRGRGQAAIMLYWPQKEVRKEGLTSYRIDVTEDYEGDGFIEFRKGRKVLHREPFVPDAFATVKAMPESVREAIKTNSTVTWGVYFESKRKKPVTAKFKVIKKAKADRKLAKLEKSSFYRRQPPLVKALMRVDVLSNYRLYTEALVGSLAVLQDFPDSTQPYRGIVQTAQRLGLKETPLFTAAAQHVSGRGGRAREGLGGIGEVDNGGAQATPLLPEFAAPTPTAEESSGGTQPSSGVTVRPTEEAGEQPDEPTLVDRPEAGTDPVVNDLRRQIEELEQRATQADEVERQMEQAEQRFGDAEQAVRDSEQAVQDAVAEREGLPDGDPGIREAEEAVREAQEALQAAREQHESADRERQDARAQALEELGSTGTSADNRAELERLRNELEEAESRTDGLPGTTDPATTDPASVPTTQPDPIADAARSPEALAQRVRTQEARFASARQTADGAAQALADAQALPAGDPDRDARIAEAQAAHDRAQDELNEARSDFENAQQEAAGGPTAGDPTKLPGTQPDPDQAANEALQVLTEQIRVQHEQVNAMEQHLTEARAQHDTALQAIETAAQDVETAEAAGDADEIARTRRAQEEAQLELQRAGEAVVRAQENIEQGQRQLEAMQEQLGDR